MLEGLYALIGQIPLPGLEVRFMQRAFLALLMLAPMTASLGLHVVSFRMSFFSDAISHSAFAGVALGLLLGVEPRLAMPAFGLLVGLGIMAGQRRTNLSADTIIGVFFSGVVAFGLAVVSLYKSVARDLQRFLYGDILTLTNTDIQLLVLLFLAVLLFQILCFNPLLRIGINPVVAKAQGVRTGFYQYLFAGLLSLTVMFSVWSVGVLLVTALLVVPAATARNLAKSAASTFWWAVAVNLSSALLGLILSAQPWLGTATGATIILIACGWFICSLPVAWKRQDRGQNS